jgi:hypothetical protein
VALPSRGHPVQAYTGMPVSRAADQTDCMPPLYAAPGEGTRAVIGAAVGGAMLLRPGANHARSNARGGVCMWS